MPRRCLASPRGGGPPPVPERATSRKPCKSAEATPPRRVPAVLLWRARRDGPPM